MQKDYDCIVERNSFSLASDESHGDKLVKCLENCSNAQIYYYCATNQTGIIDSVSLLEGLEWMKQKGVKKVNISLSTKKYDAKLAKWISENSDTITVYASYSNLLQSSDYPAMYDEVIGSGSNKSQKVMKKMDVAYSSNRVALVIPFQIYDGNSFLSLITMLKSG